MQELKEWLILKGFQESKIGFVLDTGRVHLRVEGLRLYLTSNGDTTFTSCVSIENLQIAIGRYLN